METPRYLLSLLPCGFFFGFAALIAVVDVRTRRGYALTIVSSLLLASTIVVVGSVIIAAQTQPQPTNNHLGGPNSLLFFYYTAAIYASALVLFAAAIEAGIAHHWLWIVGVFISALVPVLLVVPPHPGLDMNTEYWVQQVGFLGVLVAPEATVLAYSIIRLVHPIVPATARRVASSS